MALLTLYGLKNCDSCRKARKWLEAAGIDYRFHDVRSDGLDRSMLQRWSAALGWEALLNRRSTTWRGLDDAAKDVLDERRAIDLILAHPTLMKRPVGEAGDRVVVGFTPASYEAFA